MTAGTAIEDLRQAFERARDMDGSMNERLGLFADAMRRLNPAYTAIADRLVHRLAEHHSGTVGPKLGEMMPSFVLPDENGRLVSLTSLLQKGPAVVTFHRGHWCPFCRISINTLAKAQPQIEALGAGIVAIIPERGSFIAEMKSDSNVRFPILSDIDNGYALSLNLAIWVGNEMEEYLAKAGRVVPRYQGSESWLLPIPATFAVGADGRIKARFVDPDYRKRMTVEELIDSLK